MIPLHLRMAGFLSYRDPVEIDFTQFELACITGHNGAGKSSLLDAMTWALFGEARGRNSDIINLHPSVKAAEVALTFSYEQNIYRVLRSLPRGRSAVLEFQIQDNDGWRALSERSLRETQARIEQILRLDYETFVNASFFLQGRADQFTQQTAGKRKDVLSSILGLEIWELYKQRTAEKRKAIESEVSALDGRIAEIDAELAEEGSRRQRLKELEAEWKHFSAARQSQENALENLRKMAASLDQQLAAEKAKLEEERRVLKEREREAGGQAAELKDYEHQLEAERKALAEAEEKAAGRGQIEEKRSTAGTQLAQWRAENDLLKTQMDEIKERMERLESAEGAVCPLCGQPLSAQHRESTLKQLQAEGKEKGDRFRINRTRMDDLTKQIAEYESNLGKIVSAERERMEHSNTVTQLTERIETLRGAIKRWEEDGAKRLQEVEAALAEKRDAVGVQKPSVTLEEAERELNHLRERENQKRDEVVFAQQRVTVLEERRKRKAEHQSEREALTVQIARHRTLERAFGKDGVPALLIEQALPQIEAKANELLDRLSEGQMSVRFVTQAEYKDKKRGDLKETLDIQISDPAGMRDYEMYSGGEAFRVNFAIRLALSEVLAQRKGARLQTLVIDEGFGSQDAQGRQRLIEAINLVKNDFAKILIITHLDELKDAFPNRIEVEKTERGSSVRVV